MMTIGRMWTDFESNALVLVTEAVTAADNAIREARVVGNGLTTAATPPTASFDDVSLTNVVVAEVDGESTDDEQLTVSSARTRINMIKGHVKYVSAEVASEGRW